MRIDLGTVPTYKKIDPHPRVVEVWILGGRPVNVMNCPEKKKNVLPTPPGGLGGQHF